MNITSYADSWLRLMRMGFEGNLAGQDLLNFEISIGAIIMILLIIIAGCIQLIAIERQRQHQAALRQSILGSQMISAGNFLGNWKTTKSGNKVTGGYKMLDQPGCYVIVTSPSPDGKAYENVYVGQSLYECFGEETHQGIQRHKLVQQHRWWIEKKMICVQQMCWYNKTIAAPADILTIS